jgi:hypothetical protein
MGFLELHSCHRRYQKVFCQSPKSSQLANIFLQILKCSRHKSGKFIVSWVLQIPRFLRKHENSETFFTLRPQISSKCKCSLGDHCVKVVKWALCYRSISIKATKKEKKAMPPTIHMHGHGSTFRGGGGPGGSGNFQKYTCFTYLW